MSTSLAISSSTVAVLVVILLVDIFAIAFGMSFARGRRAERDAAAA